MTRALLVGAAAAVLAAVLFGLVLRGWARGALVATGLVGFIVFGRELAVVVRNAINLAPGWQSLIIGSLVVVAVVMVGRLAIRGLRRPGGVAAWTVRLNALAVILLLVVGLSALTRGTIPQAIADLRQGVPLHAATRAATDSNGPDIYVILLDGYARHDVLADHFGFDNSEFLSSLAARDFQVAPASHSNYMFTQLTLISMFHMAQLTDIPALEPVVRGEARDQPAGRMALDRNPTFEALRDHGYRIAAFAAPYEDISLRGADIFIDAPQLTEFEWQLVASTFLLDAIAWLSPDLFPSQQRARINGVFTAAAEVARDQELGQRLLFVHVLAPHTPLVFGPNGEPLDVPALRRTEDTAAGLGLTEEEFSARFVGQTQYVNKRTLELIDTILDASSQPPVIIVMSDHGSRSRPLDPAKATPEDLRERYGTLFAAHTPGHPGLYPADVASVEVMGRLLEAYLEVPFDDPGRGTYYSHASDPFALTLMPEPPPPGPGR